MLDCMVTAWLHCGPARLSISFRVLCNHWVTWVLGKPEHCVYGLFWVWHSSWQTMARLFCDEWPGHKFCRMVALDLLRVGKVMNRVYLLALGWCMTTDTIILLQLVDTFNWYRLLGNLARGPRLWRVDAEPPRHNVWAREHQVQRLAAKVLEVYIGWVLPDWFSGYIGVCAASYWPEQGVRSQAVIVGASVMLWLLSEFQLEVQMKRSKDTSTLC